LSDREIRPDRVVLSEDAPVFAQRLHVCPGVGCRNIIEYSAKTSDNLRLIRHEWKWNPRSLIESLSESV
jgi:hypothetical protein